MQGDVQINPEVTIVGPIKAGSCETSTIKGRVNLTYVMRRSSLIEELGQCDGSNGGHLSKLVLRSFKRDKSLNW